MKQNRASRIVVAAVVATSALLAACSLNPKEDPTRYYVLSNAVDEPGLLEAAGLPVDWNPPQPVAGLTVGIRPVSFPSYLKRSRMVTRLASNELKYMETERWGEPLEEAFHYALAVDLGVMLGTDDVILHPWYATEKPEYAVMVDVVRFERDQQGTAHLVVRWELRDAEGDVVTTDGFKAEEDADPTSILASVQAQSRTVAALSRQIADAIQKAAS